MIQYILECIAFQLVFLVIYDFFLKRETFFQWNRAYLIGTYVLSMVLPWVKIEALKDAVPQQYYIYPEYLWGANDAVIAVSEESWLTVSWEYMLLFGGMLFAALFFGYKMMQLYRLRKNGEVHSFNDFTKIIISNSSLAFSFFKSVFMGDKILESEHENIIRHELVHIRQRHSWDLLFFEMMRIVGWFNPLVYVYQGRVSELHEFIADSHVAKTDKKEQYEFLLSQVFQTGNISFINQFFKSSLVKKRIIMLQKTRSKKVWQLKYLLLVPLVLGMLFYTSCENEVSKDKEPEDSANVIAVNDIENLTQEEENLVYSKIKVLSGSNEQWELKVKDSETTLSFVSTDQDVFITGVHNEPIRAQMSIDFKDSQKRYKNFFGSRGEPYDWKEAYRKENLVPFAYADKGPIFPGCEDAENGRDCFQKSIQEHIRKHFNYPKAAQEQGIQGRVNTMFTMDEEGNITDIRKRGPHKLLEDEAVRIIKRLPKMTPGKYEGKTVKVPFSIPITFRLQSSESDAGYERLKKEQISQLPNDIQIKYQNALSIAEVAKAPIFPGCEDASDFKACLQEKIQRHISKNFRYPEEARKKGMQGRVSIIFLIDEDGNITNISKRGPDKSLEEEADRIISKLPKMKPGKHEGQEVKVSYSIPITFKLQ